MRAGAYGSSITLLRANRRKRWDNFTTSDLVIVLIIAFGTVIGANILDYYKYKRTNAKLMEYIEKRNKPK